MDRAAIKEEIARLVKEGTMLRAREALARASPEERREAAAQFAKDEAGSSSGTKKRAPKSASSSGTKVSDDELTSILDNFFKKPDFGSEYQEWYSLALRVVEQLLPGRYDEFRELYRRDRRKTIDLETYCIADYIAGIQVTRGLAREPAFNVTNRALNNFGQQISILTAAEACLESSLADISRSLQAEILDNELDTARALLKASHVRSAGVVAGVVLEGHLKKLITDHRVSFRKKAMLSNLNDALKDAGVYGVPLWRRIQHLTDIRNLCGHRAERDPERSEVEDLINEVARIIKTVF